MTNSEKFNYVVMVAVALLVLLLLMQSKVSTYRDGTIVTKDFYGNIEVEHNISYSEFVRRKN